MLVLGLNPDSDLAHHIQTLAPTVLFVDNEREMAQTVRQGDYDAAILWRRDAELEDHLFVLQFGGVEGDSVRVPSIGLFKVRSGNPTVAREFGVPDDLPSAVATLVRNELVPAVLNRQENSTIAVTTVERNVTSSESLRHARGSVVSPFLLDGDARVVAGRNARTGGNAEWWSLPGYVPNPERWIAAAIDAWRERDSLRFPAPVDWQARDEWKTDAEVLVSERITAVDEERRTALRRFQEERAALEQEQAEAIQNADSHERRLLTAQGDDLVAEVKATLEELGFSVIDVDAEVASAGDRREDLRVTDAEAPEWIALVEVRGYVRGAQLNDLLRLGRFVVRFARDEGHEPSAVWYVVNQFIGSDPSTRPLPLGSNPTEVETFGEDGGVVIDSADLFIALMRVRRGEWTASEARARMRASGARLDLK